MLRQLILTAVFTFLPAILFPQAYVIENVPTAAYMKGGVWRFIDSEGDIIYETENIIEFGGYSEGMAHAKIRHGAYEKWVYMDLQGNVVLEPDCDKLTSFSEGAALLIKDVQIGDFQNVFAFMGKSGKMITPYKFIDAYPFSEGLAWARTLDTMGYIDKSGRYVITLDSLVGYSFHEGLARVNNYNFRMGFINKKGELAVDTLFDEVGPFSEGLAFAHRHSRSGYINKEGQYAIKPIYQDGRAFSEGRAFIGFFNKEQKMKWGAIDKNGEALTPAMFDLIRNYSEGRAAVAYQESWGFLDEYGKLDLGAVFSSAGSFHYGMAWASMPDKKYGYINRHGYYKFEIEKPEAVYDLRMNARVY